MKEILPLIKSCIVCAGECLGGALWWKDLLQLAEEAGFSQPRLVTAADVTVDNKELQEILGLSRFSYLWVVGVYV